MSREDPKMRIQDYLDGRMNEAERGAFEAQLAGDATLARRVEDYRIAGQALRADPPALSPGFHTRLRARYEAARRPAPRWFRLLSWETAGIATAVVLAVALFTPFLFRQGLAPAEPAALEPMLELERQQRTDEYAEPPAGQETPGRSSRIVLDEKEQAAKVGTDDLDEPEAKPDAAENEEREWAPAPPVARDLRDAEQKNEPQDEVGSLEETGEGEKAARKKEEAGVRKAGVAEDAAAPAPLEAAPSQEKLKKRDVGGEQDAFRARSELSGMASAPQGFELQPGAVDPGAVVEVTDEAGWNVLIRGQATDRFADTGGLGELGDYTPGVRIVLVGPRGHAVDCRRTIVRSTEETYEIRLVPPAPGTSEHVHGCAVRLPDDGRSIRIIDAEPAP